MRPISATDSYRLAVLKVSASDFIANLPSIREVAGKSDDKTRHLAWSHDDEAIILVTSELFALERIPQLSRCLPEVW